MTKLDPKMLEIAKAAYTKFGAISVPYLMRKLQCNSEMAKMIMKELDGLT